MGIRSEDLQLAAERVSGRTIQAKIEIVEPIRNATYVNVYAGGFSLVAGVGRNRTVRPNESLVLKPFIEKIHLFDTEQEVNLCRKQ